MKINSMIKAELNSNITEGVILSFLSGLNESCSYDLLLIATAFIYSKDCRETLGTANKRSTIQSIFNSKDILGDNIRKMILWGNVSQRIEVIREVFNDSLIDLYNRKMIDFGRVIKSKYSFDYKAFSDDIIKSYFRASYYLGIMMKKCDSNDVIDSVLRRI